MATGLVLIGKEQMKVGVLILMCTHVPSLTVNVAMKLIAVLLNIIIYTLIINATHHEKVSEQYCSALMNT